MTNKDKEKQLREELLLEFEVNAPANEKLPQLEARLKALRDEEAEKERSAAGTGQGGAELTAKAPAVDKAAAAEVKAGTFATVLEQGAATAVSVSVSEGTAKETAEKPAVVVVEDVVIHGINPARLAALLKDAGIDVEISELKAPSLVNPVVAEPEPQEPVTVLMVTKLTHEYVDEAARNKRSVRVSGDQFYTTEPESYAGVAEVIGELAEAE
jgi:hypothetical protein